MPKAPKAAKTSARPTTTKSRKPAYQGPRFQRRLYWLTQLVAENGGAKVVGEFVETPDTHISAMTSGSRGVGDELADRIEKKYKKPNGWLDQPLPDEAELRATDAGRSNVINLQAHSLFTQIMSIWRAAALHTPKHREMVAAAWANLLDKVDEADAEYLAQQLAAALRPPRANNGSEPQGSTGN